MMPPVIVSQVVDTLKLHLYQSNLNDDAQKRYNEVFSMCLDYKARAQEIQATNNDVRVVKVTIGGQPFNVRASAIRGFSVVLENEDISIALRKLSASTPFARLEFRSSFLVRAGHVHALNFALDFCRQTLLYDFLVKVSELHIATDIQGYEFSELDLHRFKTRSRRRVTHREESHIQNSYYWGFDFTGFELGGGNKRLRIYNKTLEIKKNENKGYIKNRWLRCPDYDESKTVWRVEAQFRREYLKTLTTENGLLDGFENVLNSIPHLMQMTVDDFSLRDLSDEDALAIMQKKVRLKSRNEYKPLTREACRNRLKRALPFHWWTGMGWNTYYGEKPQIFTNINRKAFSYVRNAIKGAVGLINAHYGHLSDVTFCKAFADADKAEIEEKNQTLIDSVMRKQAEQFAKIQYQKEVYGIIVDCHDELDGNLIKYANKTYQLLEQNHSLNVADEILRKVLKNGDTAPF